MEIRIFKEQDEAAVVDLWKDCGLVMPQNNPRLDIKRKTAFQSDLFLVGVENNKIIATLMAGYEGHRGWLNYLAVSPKCRRCGLGRQMVFEAEKQLKALGCPKINLQVRKSNARVMDFYKSLGFVQDQVVSFGKRLTDS